MIAMTIDHLAAYGFEIPVFGAHFDTLRIIGRIAAPLFFFALTESVKHTRSKVRLILRLYLGAVGTECSGVVLYSGNGRSSFYYFVYL